MNKRNILKRVVVFAIIALSTLTLVACKKDKPLNIPYGSLGDTVYLSGTGYSITEKQLYKEMRITDISVLEKMIYKALFNEEIEKITSNKEDYSDELIDLANENIFATKKLEDLKELTDKEKDSYIKNYLDLVFFEGLYVNSADIDSVNFKEHDEAILDHYIFELAKKIYAKELLLEEIDDEDSSVFINKYTDIEDYFTNNIKTRYPLSSINIRFTNSYEAEQTLRHFNLKAYRSQWYVLQDPRTEVVTGYSLEVLEDLDLADKNGNLTESEHKLYYDKYVINPTREPAEDADQSLQLEQVLQVFFEIYNFVYPYRKQIKGADYATIEDVLNDPLLVNDDEDNLGIFTKLYKDYPTSQSSFRTYIYNTLSVEENGTRYTASPRDYGDYYFITFKLQDHNDDIKDRYDEEDNFVLWKGEAEEELMDYAEEYLQKLIEQKLTSSYISNKADARLEKAKVKIYDELLYLNLEQEGQKTFKLQKKSSKTLVAKVNDVEITADDLYAELEVRFGVNIAMDLAIKQILLSSEYMEKITKTEMKQYRENVETIIQQFSQNAYESSGFPASMGRKTFLRLSFRSETIDEAVERIYVQNELESLYVKDYEGHNENIYQLFADFANRLQSQFFSITTSHLLIYVDMDEDESPDKPEEFFASLDEDQVVEYKQMILELMQLIHDKANKYNRFEDGLQAIVNEYNESTKFRSAACDAEENKEARPECTWAKYKRAGFFLKFEDLGETENNYNYPDTSGGFDEKFFERLEHLFHEIKAEYYEVDKKFPSQKLDIRPVSFEGDEEKSLLQTDFGWHLILVTDGAVSSSAKFTYDDDIYDSSVEGDEEVKIYEKITIKNRLEEEIILNAYNDEDTISVNQVQIYMYEYESDYGVTSLPTDVLKALNAYLNPIKTKYDNSYMKMHLLHKLLLETDYVFANANNQTKIQDLLAINVRQFLSYATEEDKLFYEVYGDWFNFF